MDGRQLECVRSLGPVLNLSNREGDECCRTTESRGKVADVWSLRLDCERMLHEDLLVSLDVWK